MITIGLLTGLLVAATPKVGDVAPDFTATDSEGKAHTLSEMVKQGTVIVAFFPKAFTSGCTRELTGYKERYAEVEKAGAQVLAVSADDAATLNKFKESLSAKFTFVPDPESKLINAFDVKMPVLSMAQRFTFVVGEGRKVLKVQSGSDAIDASAAVAACPLRKKDAEAAGAEKK